MTGAIQASNPGLLLAVSLTLGTPGSNLFGFSSTGGYGAISPTALKGKTIRVISSGLAFADLDIVIDDITLTQAFFRRVAFISTAGAYVSLDSSAASFSAGATTVEWRFGLGAAPYFTSTAGPRLIMFYG